MHGIKCLSRLAQNISLEWGIRDCVAISALWLQTYGVSDTSENKNTFSDTIETKAKQSENWSFPDHKENLKNSQLLDTGLL